MQNGAPPTPYSDIKENLGYNCIEYSSLIEILSIDEQNNTIEFKCINKHNNIKSTIKEYLEKMKRYNDITNLNDNCEVHNNQKNEYSKFVNFCFDCKSHLCKECLKTKKHKNHNKSYIFELQPNEEDLNKIKKKFEKIHNDIKNLKIEKENKIKEIKNIIIIIKKEKIKN